MKTIDITTILGTELKSRTSARDFAAYLRNMKVTEAYVDFSRVKSVTRSFMDEFYQLLLKADRVRYTTLILQNMNQQTEVFLESVKQSSNHPRPVIDEGSNARFVNLQTVQQLNEYFESINK